MADIISTSPDFNHYEASKPKIEAISTVPENLDNKTKNILIDTKNKTAVILVSAESRKQSKELKKEVEYSNKEITFLKKFYSTTNNDEIKSSIEHKTIKIYEIEWTDKIAISLDWKNVDYIYNSDWTEYFDLKWRREDDTRKKIFEKITWLEEVSINYILNIKETENIYPPFSYKYFEVLLKWIKKINLLNDSLQEAWELMKKEWN